MIGLLKLYFFEALCNACPSSVRVGGSTNRRWCDEKTIRLLVGAAMVVELQRMIRRSRLKKAWVIVFAITSRYGSNVVYISLGDANAGKTLGFRS